MNKGELRTFFKDTLNKPSITDTQADSFIDTAMRRLQRLVRIPSMEAESTFTVTDPFTGITIPSDYLELKDIYLDDTVENTNKLRKLPLDRWLRTYDNGSGVPAVYYRRGSVWMPKPTPSAGKVFKIIYYADFTTLTLDADTNALTIAAPELIAYTALVFASVFYRDIRKEEAKELSTELLNELRQQAEDDEWSGADMSVQTLYQDVD